MPFFKCSWFFDGVQENPGTTAPSMVGWTETWYTDATSVENAVIRMRDPGLQSWVRKRVAFLPSIYQIRWVRASAVDNPRLTKTAAMQSAVAGEISRLVIPQEATVAAQINCCILSDAVVMPVELADKTHHRRMLTRGLTRSMIDGNIVNEQSQAFASYLRFMDYVAGGRAPIANPVPASPWLIRIQDPTQIFQPITAFQVDPTNSRNVIISAALPLVSAGAKITIRGVPYPRGVNRTWTVLANAPAGGPYRLGKSRFDLSGTYPAGSGTANLVKSLYRGASQYLVIGLRNKKTGRPFRLTRGRSRVL